MGEVAVLDPVAADLPAWWDAGSHLLTERREIDWKLADWLNDGAKAFGAQRCFEFVADQLTVDPKQLREKARVAMAFPPALRAPDVPFEVHGCLSTLPQDKLLPTIKQAAEEKWTLRRARNEATVIRQQAAMFEDEDYDDTCCKILVREYNSSSIGGRELFYEYVRSSAKRGFGVINPNKVMLDD